MRVVYQVMRLTQEVVNVIKDDLICDLYIS